MENHCYRIGDKMTQRTIAEVINSAKVGDVLTDGKRKWKIVEFDDILIGMPMKKGKGSFEIWATGLEEHAILPGLRIEKVLK